MGANSAEMKKLDSGSVHGPTNTISGDTSVKYPTLNDYVRMLEAIRRLKEEKTMTEVQPVTVEFLPLKGNSGKDELLVGGKGSADKSDMKNWMSSARLWSAAGHIKPENNHADIMTKLSKLGDGAESGSAAQNPWALPFKGQYSGLGLKEDPSFSPIEGLSPGAEMVGSMDLNFEAKSSSSGSDYSSFTDQIQPIQRWLQKKKQRRCWSPELHRRFLDAIQRLGGAHRATPKHIREIMMVDDLSNDEVKSHLQKYRMHVRKLPASSVASTSTLLRMPRDQCGDVSKVKKSRV